MNSLIKCFAFVAVVILAGCVFIFPNSFEEFSALLRKNSNPYIFLLFMSVGCALPMPLTFCYMYAGLTFHPVLAWVLCVGGLFFSSTIGYFLGRLTGSAILAERMCLKFKFDISSKKNSFGLNFFVRAVPGVPYWAQNIVLASVGTSYFLYEFVNICVQGLISLFMVLFFDRVMKGGFETIFIFAILAIILAFFYKMIVHSLFRN